MTDLFVVWTPAALLAAIVGGNLLGLLLVARFDNPRFSATESVGVIALVGTFAAAVFWSGQIVDTLVADGPTLAWRVVSRFGLFLVFVGAMALGTGIGIRRARGTWQ